MTWKLSLTNPDRTNGLGANRAVTGSRRGEDGINTPTSPSVGLLFVTKDRGVLVIVGILKIMSAAIQFPCRNCQRRPQPSTLNQVQAFNARRSEKNTGPPTHEELFDTNLASLQFTIWAKRGSIHIYKFANGLFANIHNSLCIFG